jgi:hypothetical protein
MRVLQGSGCSKQGDGCEGYGYAGKEVAHLSCYGIVPASGTYAYLGCRPLKNNPKKGTTDWMVHHTCGAAG